MIESLRLFQLVAREGSFTRAAELAGLTRPAVSQHIKHLEERFGLPLFVRSTRQVALTPAGEALLPHAERILGAVNEMEAAMAALRPRAKVVVEVAASTLPGESLLPRALARFRADHPEAEVRVRIANTEAVLGWVREGRADLGLVGQEVDDPWLESEQVGVDEIVLALRPGVSLPDPLPPGQLRQVPLVMREAGSATRATVLHALGERGIGPEDLNVVAEVGSPEALKTALRSGVGDAFVSLSALSPGEFACVRLEGLRITRPICAVWQRHRPPADLHRALLECLAALTE
ncbi:DNA-binding transcriptional LysR family regulator [Symbiobacterium terraclitae]|uniref:DNA-binding transcriptional LysR family regulator n=1 Tax=Symbiobacterium terraclitae TaxID=557451 RepID=A0ABS4JT52_9FIRM|nr:LysR family transcriptional regulator [Symbiobacterium terraclitae]MBP2018718.1 DNA-binding transcriptional LysR family regulator [Symbiobacterium terraclitae]